MMDGVISYLRTAAQIKSLLAMGMEKVMALLSSKKIRVRLRPLMQQMLIEKKDEPEYLDRIASHVMNWQDSRGLRQLGPAVLLYHHTGAKALHGFRYEKVHYEKKMRSVYKKQRSAFSRGIRQEWIKHIAKVHREELLNAKISAEDIHLMLEKGQSPSGYQVHHRLPLDDGGDNGFHNLILIRDDVEHRAIHGYYNPGELRINLLSEGKSANVVIPIPPKDAVIYPNPVRGLYCDSVPNSQLVELYNVD